jgi:hypothetical protein
MDVSTRWRRRVSQDRCPTDLIHPSRPILILLGQRLFLDFDYSSGRAKSTKRRTASALDIGVDWPLRQLSTLPIQRSLARIWNSTRRNSR